MTISISERSLNGLASCSGCETLGSLRGSTFDFEADAVAGSALEPYAGQHVELPDTWIRTPDAIAVPAVDLNFLLVEGFSVLTPGEPGSADWAKTLVENASEIVYAQHPDMGGSAAELAESVQISDLQGARYTLWSMEALVAPVILFIDAGYQGMAAQLPSVALTAPLPAKPPSRVAYAGVVGWGLVVVGLGAGAWYGLRKLARRR